MDVAHALAPQLSSKVDTIQEQLVKCLESPAAVRRELLRCSENDLYHLRAARPSLLYVACERRQTTVAYMLASEFAFPLRAALGDFTSPIQVSASQGDTATTELLLSMEPSLASLRTRTTQRTLLHLAAASDDSKATALIDALLKESHELRRDVDARDAGGHTALSLAAHRGHFATVAFLMSERVGAQINVVAADRYMPWMSCVDFHRPDLLRLLLPPREERQSTYSSPLQYVAISSSLADDESLNLMQMLIAMGEDAGELTGVQKPLASLCEARGKGLCAAEMSRYVPAAQLQPPPPLQL